MIYELRHCDNILLKFDYNENLLAEKRIDIIFVNEELRYLLPIGLKLNHYSLYLWLKDRIIKKNRINHDRVCAVVGTHVNSVTGIINASYGLSLNDCYWIVPDGFTGTFAEYNLYDHNFNTAIMDAAFLNIGQPSSILKPVLSPEFTTHGTLKKCWIHKYKGIYLVKAGFDSGLEPYSEYYASQIASFMNIEHVEYNLIKYKGEIVSCCKLFTSKDISFVPMYKLVNNDSIKSTIDVLKQLGDTYYNKFVDMMIFDSLIFNTDRHLGNFGVIVDNKTNKIIDFAPLFDNGNSLFSNVLDDYDFIIKTEKIIDKISAFYCSFNDITKALISERQIKMLENVSNFKIKKHSGHNL